MTHSSEYRAAYRKFSRESEALSDGQLRSSYAEAYAALDWHVTPKAQARHDAYEAEMDHRDAYN